MSTDAIRLIEVVPVAAPAEQIDPVNPLDVDFGAARLMALICRADARLGPGVCADLSAVAARALA